MIPDTSSLASWRLTLSDDEQQRFLSLDTPVKIQAFLDTARYEAGYANRCPTRVLREGVAHCLDGAIFAAAALRQIGYPPLLVDLFPDPGADDDHVLAIFWRDSCVGAVAKSNYAGLRYREPVFRTLRDLVLSYFEDFFNLYGQKTLRTHTRPLNLTTLDRYNWMGSDAGADRIEKRLLQLKRYPLISAAAISNLAPLDPLSYQAGTVGTLPEGVYKPRSI